ncbi:MAG: SDR family oxidoreductase [Patescibacteria group bacterium]
MTIDFKNQTVLITGATRGIGKQLAEDFARLHANLILTGMDEKGGKMPKGSGWKKYYVVDFTDPVSFSGFLKELSAFKRIDICINNAGTNVTSNISEIKDADLDSIIEVNLRAPLKITSTVSKIMKKNKYGRIVNIASIWSVISKSDKSIYTATKFGIRGLTVASAIDLAPHNILVNAVSPGVVDSGMSRRMLGKKGMKEWAKKVPLGRLAKPEDISSAVLFLASKENTYITAQNLVVDGGFVNV